MRIIYCYPEPLPSEMARSIQVVNTCVSIAGLIDHVFLYIPGPYMNTDQLFSFYGIKKPVNMTVRFLKKSFGPIISNKIFNLRLKSIISKDSPDIIMTRHLKTASFLLGNPVPLIFEAHEIFGDKNRAKVKNLSLEKGVYEKADGITFLSRGLSNAMKKKYLFHALSSVIPSGTSLPIEQPQKNIDKKKSTLVTYTGTSRYKWKGIPTLIKALELLPGDIIFEIVGQLDEEYQKNAILDQLISTGNLTITGHLPPKDAILRLKQADIAVIPNSGMYPISKYYTCPLKLLEAMAAGTTIVASDLPSIREIVSEDEAIMVTADNPKALAEGILKAAGNPILRKTLTKKAWQRVQDFSWDNRAKKIVELFEKVMIRASC